MNETRCSKKKGMLQKLLPGQLQRKPLLPKATEYDRQPQRLACEQNGKSKRKLSSDNWWCCGSKKSDRREKKRGAWRGNVKRPSVFCHCRNSS